MFGTKIRENLRLKTLLLSVVEQIVKRIFFSPQEIFGVFIITGYNADTEYFMVWIYSHSARSTGTHSKADQKVTLLALLNGANNNLKTQLWITFKKKKRHTIHLICTKSSTNVDHFFYFSICHIRFFKWSFFFVKWSKNTTMCFLFYVKIYVTIPSLNDSQEIMVKYTMKARWIDNF